MSNMLSTGVSGLRAFQTALDTTSHNISNSSTVGYSRQSVSLSAAIAQYTGSGYVGSGVDVDAISRSYNDLVAAQVRSSSSSKNQWDAYSTLAEEINNLFSDSSTGLTSSLQSFFDSFQDVANSPASSAERQVLLSNAQSLVSQLQTYNTKLSGISAEISEQLESEATTITGIAQSIADLNGQIAVVTSSGGAVPNDMLDQRDNLLDQLAEHVNLSTVKQDDGSINVYIGSGQSLVVGNRATAMVTVQNEYDATQKGLALQTSTGTVEITDALSGGSVGGLLSFRSEMLLPAQNALGRVAVSVATLVNEQQNAGMDLYGDLGADLFNLGNVAVRGSIDNAGTGDLDVTRSDVSALTGDNYLLTKTASGWAMRNTSSGATVTLSGSGTVASPFVADGLSIVVSGTASTGDTFLIQPTSNAISSMSLALTDPSAIAAAAPILASASSSNSGSASITQGEVLDATDANLRTAVTIQFLSASTYTTDGGTTVSNYTSGSDIDLNGWRVSISGTPSTGDTFTVGDNSSGTGDNRNALLMANLLTTDALAGGTKSISDVVNSWVAQIGVSTGQAQSSLTIQTSLYEDNINAQQSISGVNLDEEAANLVRYQQAYSAAAQVIKIANELFDSLLQAVS